jgi:paraquat-inducible protein B
VKPYKDYIPVFIEVYPDSFEVVGEKLEAEEWKKALPELIELGLRGQLVTLSYITGQLAVDIDMYPDTPVVLKNLDEDYQEIPSIQSTLARMGKSLEKFNLNEINSHLVSILASADRILKNHNIDDSLNELKGVLQDARGLVGNVNAKVDPLAHNLNGTMNDTRKLLNNVDEKVKPLTDIAITTMQDFSNLARDVDAKLDHLSTSVTQAFNSVDSAFKSIGDLVGKDSSTRDHLENTLKSIDDLVGKDSSTRDDLENTLKELSGAARSIRLLADYLEQHPDALLKGKTY